MTPAVEEMAGSAGHTGSAGSMEALGLWIAGKILIAPLHERDQHRDLFYIFRDTHRPSPTACPLRGHGRAGTQNDRTHDNTHRPI